jgi:hypothetical protein
VCGFAHQLCQIGKARSTSAQCCASPPDFGKRQYLRAGQAELKFELYKPLLLGLALNLRKVRHAATKHVSGPQTVLNHEYIAAARYMGLAQGAA